MDFDTAISAGKDAVMKYALPMIIGTVIMAFVLSLLKK